MTNKTRRSDVALLAAAGVATLSLYSYGIFSRPAFSDPIVKTLWTEADYTPPAIPPLVPVEIHAIRHFSKNAIGEEIILHENGGTQTITLKRLTQNSGVSDCALFEVTHTLQKPERQNICSSPYPSGL